MDYCTAITIFCCVLICSIKALDHVYAIIIDDCCTCALGKPRKVLNYILRQKIRKYKGKQLITTITMQ